MLARSPTGRKQVFGVAFAPMTLEQAVDNIVREPATGGVRMVVTTNLDHVVNLSLDDQFREAYSSAWLATADGAPVFVYARLVGADIPERVPGPDLFAATMHAMNGAHRPFFFASCEDTAEKLAAWLVERGLARDTIGWAVPPFGFEKTPEASQALVDAIAAHAPTHLFLGVGSPKSEMWIYQNREKLGSLYALGVGAALDFFVNVQQRAPLWVRKIGGEWLWRWMSEPQRLFPRYFIKSWLVFPAVLNDLASHGESPAPRPR